MFTQRACPLNTQKLHWLMKWHKMSKKPSHVLMMVVTCVDGDVLSVLFFKFAIQIG